MAAQIASSFGCGCGCSCGCCDGSTATLRGIGHGPIIDELQLAATLLMYGQRGLYFGGYWKCGVAVQLVAIDSMAMPIAERNSFQLGKMQF